MFDRSFGTRTYTRALCSPSAYLQLLLNSLANYGNDIFDRFSIPSKIQSHTKTNFVHFEQIFSLVLHTGSYNTLLWCNSTISGPTTPLKRQKLQTRDFYCLCRIICSGRSCCRCVSMLLLLLL